MKEVNIKIHIERDYSYAEFDALIDLDTGRGMPSADIISSIWDSLPAKDNPDTPKPPKAPPPRREPPATAAQRRLLEKAGEWKEGITKVEATKLLTELGY